MLYTKKQAEPPYALRGFLPVVKVNNKLCMHVDIPHVCTSCQASTRETTQNDESGGTVCLRARKQALERAQVVRLARERPHKTMRAGAQCACVHESKRLSVHKLSGWHVGKVGR